MTLKNKKNNSFWYFEDSQFTGNLNHLTKFNSQTFFFNKNFCNKICLNWGFKDIKFEKKQMVIFFMLMELFTNQKCVLTVSHKNVLSLKLKKGSITGCKITLRKENLFKFLETLILGFPRSEIFKGFSFKKNTLKKNTYSTKISNLYIFYVLESELTSFINALDINFIFNTVNDIEKCFFFTHFKFPIKYF